jgi:hypothetical protein
MTYAWMMAYRGSAGQQANVILYNENVRFVNSTTTKIVIGNSGTGDTHIVRLFLDPPSNNLTDISSGKALRSRSTVTISVTLPNGAANDWITRETSYFKVVPNIGQAFPFQARAHQIDVYFNFFNSSTNT